MVVLTNYNFLDGMKAFFLNQGKQCGNKTRKPAKKRVRGDPFFTYLLSIIHVPTHPHPPLENVHGCSSEGHSREWKQLNRETALTMMPVGSRRPEDFMVGELCPFLEFCLFQCLVDGSHISHCQGCLPPVTSSPHSSPNLVCPEERR